MRWIKLKALLITALLFVVSGFLSLKDQFSQCLFVYDKPAANRYSDWIVA
jgi:hypothetical protein